MFSNGGEHRTKVSNLQSHFGAAIESEFDVSNNQIESESRRGDIIVVHGASRGNSVPK
jgi:hypothetical protein